MTLLPVSISDLPILDLLCKCHHILCGLLGLASFTVNNVSKAIQVVAGINGNTEFLKIIDQLMNIWTLYVMHNAAVNIHIQFFLCV